MQRKYHPLSERIVDILTKKVNNTDRHFFRILVSYYISKVASMMRCNIETKDRGVIPVNTYVLNLMVSGAGKGHSMNIMEQDFVSEFKKVFLEKVFPIQATNNIEVLAHEKAKNLVFTNKSILSFDEEKNLQIEKYQKQFERLGELAFSFDSATTPAVKQMRDKLLLAGAGSVNLELDEIGSNLTNSSEVLTAFLELYDIGFIKQKLTKNTVDSIRSEEFPGNTPTNLMMFGTPTKLLDGDKIEKLFKDFLETGYARRLLIGYAPTNKRINQLSAEDRYNQMVDTTLSTEVDFFKNLFRSFASRSFSPILTINKDNSIKLIKYQMNCEERSTKYRPHQSTLKAEMIHRYYKALKLAGAYAFADASTEITEKHLDYAFSLVEDSGDCFHALMQEKGPYERLATYICDTIGTVTQHDMIKNLPFFKGSSQQREELITLATTYGYSNNIIIKKKIKDGISFYTGETLPVTDLNKLQVSISKDITTNYVCDEIPFDQLHKLTCAKDLHYTSHKYLNGHRKTSNALPGFNMIILDCDGTVSMDVVKLLLSEYTYFMSTTKRSTKEANRFRLIIPISHTIKLGGLEYSKFMQNVYDWLPFQVDDQTKDIARKWATFPGEYHYNTGKLVDGTLFVPETKKSEELKNTISKSNVPNIERWFTSNTEEGCRASMLYRYGMVLIDSGYDLATICETITTFNSQLVNPLPTNELENQTLVSLAKKYDELNR